jgi:hypothetical protein
VVFVVVVTIGWKSPARAIAVVVIRLSAPNVGSIGIALVRVSTAVIRQGLGQLDDGHVLRR